MDYYADIKGGKHVSHPSEGGFSNPYLFLGLIFSRIHTFNKNTEKAERIAVYPLGVSGIPGVYQADITMRLFGSEQSLEAFMEDPLILSIERSNVMSLGRTKKVPNNIEKHVAWVRSRDEDRHTIAYHERRLLRETTRFISQNETSISKPASLEDRVQNIRTSERKNNFVTLFSSGTGKKFALRFTALEVSDNSSESEIGTYGLSTKDKPYFLPVM